MKYFSFIVFPWMLLSGITGCTNAHLSSSSSLSPVPAVRVNISPASQNELQRIISSSLHLKKVILASDALSKSDTIIMERTALLGNDTSRPTVFKLIKHQNQCILLNNKTKQYFPLRNTQCRTFK